MTSGTLHVVATPLGNLADLTERARSVLSQVPIVAAEDTRRTRVLLGHIDARPRLISFHGHSSEGRVNEILDLLSDGTDVALVSDAGTPTVSDPGASLVTQAQARGLVVATVPGPSAVTAAISVSGLTADRFTFLGFLPRRGKERNELIHEIAASRWTVVFYEAANRLTKTLRDLSVTCGESRQAVVTRELTKVHEDVRRGTLSELWGYYEEHPPRGEITVVVEAEPRVPKVFDQVTARERGRALLDAGETGRDAAARLASEMGISRNEAYKVITSL